jgi:hypothetical protein
VFKKEHVISTEENVGVICFLLFEVKYFYSSLIREITYYRDIFPCLRKLKILTEPIIHDETQLLSKLLGKSPFPHTLSLILKHFACFSRHSQRFSKY